MTKPLSKSKDLEIKLNMIQFEYGYSIMEAIIHFSDVIDKEPIELLRILNPDVRNQIKEYAEDNHLFKKGDKL